VLRRLIGRFGESVAIFVDRSLSPINTGLSSGWQIAAGRPLLAWVRSPDNNWNSMII
jgi:hypothetical protein